MMESFTILTARACPLPLEGIDTDQLVPARFLKRKRQEGFAHILLHDARMDQDFPLNNPAYAGARILVTRRNFGGGSSREAAVYALMDYGIRCVVAPSFGDIFASNAVGNGLLPAVVSEDDAEKLLMHAASGELTVDLQACQISGGGERWTFTIDPVWREKLLNGWDDVDLTLARQDEIDRFVQNYRARQGWAWISA